MRQPNGYGSVKNDDIYTWDLAPDPKCKLNISSHFQTTVCNLTEIVAYPLSFRQHLLFFWSLHLDLCLPQFTKGAKQLLFTKSIERTTDG